MSRTLFAVLLLACLSSPGRLLLADDMVLYHQSGTVAVELFIPSGNQPLRGVLLHMPYGKATTTDRWAEVCRQMNWARGWARIDLKETNRPRKLADAWEKSLPLFVAESGRKELPHLPMLGVGSSAGGMVLNVMLRKPDLTVTACTNVSWVPDPAKMDERTRRIPFCITLGAVPDGFNMLPGIAANFEPARVAGLPWGLAVMWDCAHDWGNSAALFAPWCMEIARQRVPHDWDPLAGPPALKDVRVDAGWLADRDSADWAHPTIAAWDAYTGAKDKAAWLPSEAVASAWRALMVKDPPLILAARGSAATIRSKPWTPKAEMDLIVEHSEHAVLFLEPNPRPATRPGDAAPAGEARAEGAVEFYAGASRIGQSAGVRDAFAWKDMPPGAHVVWGRWKDDDGRWQITPPVLVIRRVAAAQPRVIHRRLGPEPAKPATQPAPRVSPVP